MNIYDLFSTDDDAVAAEQAAALQHLLRGNQQASGLAALSGARAMQPFAQMTGQMAKQQSDQLADAGGTRLKTKLMQMQREEDRAFRHQEGELTRAAVAARQGERIAAKTARPVYKTTADGSIVAIDPTDNSVSPVTTDAGDPLKARDMELEQGTQKFGKDLEFIAKMPEDIALLKSYQGKDVPGMGPLAGRMPDWATSQEGNAARQAAMRTMNAIIYMTTGKQINEQETVRQLTARGIGPNASRAAFDAGIPRLEDELKQAAGGFRAKYSPRVIEEYRKRGGLQGMESWFPTNTLGTPLTQPQPAQSPAPADKHSSLRGKYGL